MRSSTRLVLLGVCLCGHASTGTAQAPSGTWLQCRDAAVSENGERQRPDPKFDEVLFVNLAARTVAWYGRDDGSLTRATDTARMAGPSLTWTVENAEPNGQCSFTSRTHYTLHPPTLRYTSENLYTMVCRDKPALTHVTRIDATCRAIDPQPVALHRR